MTFLKVCGVAVLAGMMCFLISEMGGRGKRAISSLFIVTFLIIFIDLAKDAVTEVMSITGGAVEKEVLISVLKIIGIGQAFGLCSSLCTELSEGGIASVVALVGKVEMLLIMLPYIKELLSFVSKIAS